jgi:NAD(P)H-hydrate epimerase
MRRKFSMKVSRISEMRNLDKRAMEEIGISQDILMENAGEAVYYVILREFGVAHKTFAVLCGGGNNGGDGLVVARKLHSSNAEIKVFLLGKRSKLRGAAKKHFKIISKMPIEIYDVTSAEQVKESILHSDAIVDALFGTGLTRDVDGVYKDVIQLINTYGNKVFSVDIPSGVNGDTGEVMGIAVEADYTVSFGLPKIGNLLYPGYELGGTLYVSHISFPPSLYNSNSIKVELFNPLRLPKRGKDTHKGNYGKALFISGSSIYLGAPYFSALSFLKAGGGLSYLAAPESISPFIASKGSEIVVVPQQETESGSIAVTSKEKLLQFSEQADIVVLGPGISLNAETQQLAKQLAGNIRKPLLIDGDGLTAIAEDLDIVKGREAKTILTPHLGEFSRITKIGINEIKKNKVSTLQRTASQWGAIIVLKGAHSLIGYPDETVFINTSGNPGMATAGSGDVLTGTIAAMYGLGFAIEEAVPMGVFIHGLSGDLATKDKGEDGVTAQDVLDYLPSALKYYRESFNEVTKDFYRSVHVI